MANAVLRDILIGGYLAVKGLSIVNKQSKIITVIKKWQQLWVVIGQANKSQWLLAIHQDKRNWMDSQKPLTIYQFMQLHSFTDKQTYDGLHVFLLKFTGGHKISFACSTQRQKSEWLTAVQKALNTCYNKKQQKERPRSISNDDWWQLSEHQEDSTKRKEFQVVLSSCSLTENINRCRVCLLPNQSCIQVYGHSTYSSHTIQWTWQYNQLYCISFDKETLTLTLQLYIHDSLEEICWSGNEALQLYNTLCKISGVWDCTAQEAEACSVADDISPTLVRLEESDYSSLGVFLPDHLVQKMEDWYLMELVNCQHQPKLLGQYEVQLSLTHLHLRGCNSPHCWSWELHHVKSYSLDTNQYLIIEIAGTCDDWSGVFYFGSSGSHDSGHITTFYELLQQLMVKLYLVVMIKHQLIVTRKQLIALMNHYGPLHNAVECFSCELLEGPSQDLLGHYTLQIFIDQIHVISNNAKWVWLLTELYSYKLDQEEVGGATYVTIQISNTSAVIEDWVWSGDHMIRFYSFLLELCQLLSQQSCQEILISKVVTIRLVTSQTITVNTYTIQLTKNELVLMDTDTQQVVCSYSLDSIKRLNLDKAKNELVISVSKSPACEPIELMIATDNAQELMIMIDKAVQDERQSFNAQLTTHHLPLDCHQSQTDTQLLSNNHKKIACHVSSDKQVSHESRQEVEYQIPTKTDINPTKTSAQQHLISAHQISGDEPAQWCPVNKIADTADVISETSWSASHKPNVAPDKQEVIDMCKIEHQTFADTAEKSTPQFAQAKHSIMIESPKTEHQSLSSFQQTQENAHQPLRDTQLPLVEFKQQVMIKAQKSPEQLQAQTQLKSKQVSIEKELSLQEANLLQIHHQTPHELLDKLNEGAHKMQKIEGESQVYILTESQHAMDQISANTQTSVELPEDIQTVLYTQAEPSFEAGSYLQTPNGSQKINSLQEVLDNETKNPQETSSESQEVTKFPVAMTTQQTLNVSTFRIPMETQQECPDDMMDQTHSEAIEIMHQYQNVRTTDKLTVDDAEQDSPLVLNESKNTVILHKSSKVEEITATEAREIPQAKIQEFSLKSQEEQETLLQSPSDAQLLQISNLEPLVKLYEAKEVTHQILSEGEVQECTSTKPQRQTTVDTQGSVDTKGSVETLESMQSISYPKQSSTDDASDECELNTQNGLPQYEINVQDELQEETKWKVAQQTSITFDQATFPTLGEAHETAGDETADQTQNVPIETTEISQQFYPNIQETLLNKPTIISTKQETEKIIQVPNEDTNRVFFHETQKASHILVEEITSREAREMAREGVQYSLTGVKSQIQTQTQQLDEAATASVKATESTLDKAVEETAQEAKVLTYQSYDNISAEIFPKVDVKQIPAETKSIESTITRIPNVDEKRMHQMTIQTSDDIQQSSHEPDKMSHKLPAELLAQRSNQIQILHQHPVETQLSSDEVQNVQHCQPPVEETEQIPVLYKNHHTQSTSVEAQEITKGSGQLYQHQLSTTIEKSTKIHKAKIQEQTLNISQDQLDSKAELGQMTSKTIHYSLPAEAIHQYSSILEVSTDTITISDTEQETTENPLVPNEQNTVISQKVNGLLAEEITPNETGEMPQGNVQQFSLKPQQEIDTQQALLHQISKLDEAKEVTNEIQMLSEGEAQEYITKPQHVMRQILADTQASAETLEGKQSVSDHEQSFTDDTSDDSELNTLNNSLDNEVKDAQEVSDEFQEETKWKVVATGQQTPIIFNQETFPKAQETAGDERVDQAQNVSVETSQIVYEDTTKKDQDASPNIQEPLCEVEQDTQCYTKAYSRQLSNNSLKQMIHTAHISTATHHIQRSPSIKHQQALLAPNGEDHQQPTTEPDKITCPFLDEDHKVVTHYNITSTDAVISYDITHQSSILQTTTQQISHDDPTHVSQWRPLVTQQLPEGSMQEGETEQTLRDTGQSLQTDGSHHMEVDMLHKAAKFEKGIKKEFPETASELNEPQSVGMHEVLMSAEPTPVQTTTHHAPHETCHVAVESKPMNQQTLMETYQTSIKPDMKFSEIPVLSDEEVEQMDQPGENEEPSTCNAQTTDNVQESLCETHDRVNNKIINQFPLAIHSTPEVYDAKNQPKSELEEYEPLKKTSQHPLQQVLFEKLQQIHAEDEGNGSVDQPSMLETKPKTSASSQQVLLESPTATDQNLQTLNFVESAQLMINAQDQTLKNEPQCIADQLPKNTKEHQQSIETECTAIKTTEIVSPIGIPTLMSSEILHPVNVYQEESTDDQQIQMLTTKEQLNDDTEEVSEVPNKRCFTFKNDQKIPPFSVEVQELTIEGDNIFCQQMGKTRPEAQLETQQMAAEKKLQETGLSVLHEISIDYRQKTVETRKTFYKTPTPEEPHITEHLFSIEAKQPLPDNEQFELQRASFRAKEVRYQVPDEPIQFESQPNLLPASNNTIGLVVTPEVVKTVKMPADNSIILPVETLQDSVDKVPEAKRYIDPMLVEFDEDVMIMDFTSDQVTTGNFNIITINSPDYLWHHYQLLRTNEKITPSGEEVSTCTIHCCNFHILVKIEKIAHKKKFSPVSINKTLHQCDLQGTRKAINDLLLKYM